MIDIRLHKALGGPGGPMNLELELQIRDGEFLALYGPSGAGKTSTLRMLAGLLKPDGGYIIVGDRPWYDPQKKIFLRPQDREVGLLFQDYALFPHLSVLKNLEYALDRGADTSHLRDLLEAMELLRLQDRKPQTLSGGQQQRVALARCLVRKPEILLLDEPLSALDPGTRHRLQDYILKMHRRYGLTTVMVSHDLGEIHKLSDRVVELSGGKIVRQGSPSDLFSGSSLGTAFTLAAEILEIQAGESHTQVVLLVQNSVLTLAIKPEKLEGFKVGDRVLLSAESFDPTLHKVD